MSRSKRRRKERKRMKRRLQRVQAEEVVRALAGTEKKDEGTYLRRVLQVLTVLGFGGLVEKKDVDPGDKKP